MPEHISGMVVRWCFPDNFQVCTFSMVFGLATLIPSLKNHHGRVSVQILWAIIGFLVDSMSLQTGGWGVCVCQLVSASWCTSVNPSQQPPYDFRMSQGNHQSSQNGITAYPVWDFWKNIKDFCIQPKTHTHNHNHLCNIIEVGFSYKFAGF